MKNTYRFLLIVLSGLMAGSLSQIIALEDTPADNQGVTLTLEQEELLLQEVLAFTAYDAYASALQTGASGMKNSLGNYLIYKMFFLKIADYTKAQKLFSDQMIDALENNWFDSLEVWIRKTLFNFSFERVEVLQKKLRVLTKKIIDLSDHSRERMYQLLRNRVDQLIPVIELLVGSEEKNKIIQKDIEEYLLGLKDSEFSSFNMPFELRKSLGIGFSEKYQNIVFDNIIQYMMFPQVWLERATLQKEVERIKQLEQMQSKTYRSWWEQLFGE